MTERKSLESERAELVALADRFMSQDIAWIEDNEAGPWLTDRESDLVSTALRSLAAQDQKPCGWQWSFGGSWHTVDTRDVPDPEKYALSISSVVRPIYTATPPAAGWDEAIETAKKIAAEYGDDVYEDEDMNAARRQVVKFIVRDIEALRHNTPPDSGAGKSGPTIGGTAFCGHGVMASLCEKCKAALPDHGGADAGAREALEKIANRKPVMEDSVHGPRWRCPSCQYASHGYGDPPRHADHCDAEIARSTLSHQPAPVAADLAIASFNEPPYVPWPDPTPAMLDGDALFDAIWETIKSWDVNVPTVYSGYCGATGNHARAIYSAVKPLAVAANASAEQWATDLPDGSVSFDAYAGWSRDQLKDRCLELIGRIEQLEEAANASAEARLREALTTIAAISVCIAVVENPHSHIEMLSNINGVAVKALKDHAALSHASDCDKQKECCDLAAKAPCADCPFPNPDVAMRGFTDLERTLLIAAKVGLNYITNTESELGVTLKSGELLRAAIAKAEACEISAPGEASEHWLKSPAICEILERRPSDRTADVTETEIAVVLANARRDARGYDHLTQEEAEEAHLWPDGSESKTQARAILGAFTVGRR